MLLQVSPLYALTQPIGAVLFCYMLLRSTAVTLWQGGVIWRDTFYPLDELRRGIGEGPWVPESAENSDNRPIGLRERKPLFRWRRRPSGRAASNVGCDRGGGGPS